MSIFFQAADYETDGSVRRLKSDFVGRGRERKGNVPLPTSRLDLFFTRFGICKGRGRDAGVQYSPLSKESLKFG